MINPKSAAVELLDFYPTEDEIEEIVMKHLDKFDADEATAHVDIIYKAPDWLNVADRDQYDAHLRDGDRNACLLVVYMSEGTFDD